MSIETIINAAWDNRADLSTHTKGEIRDAVEHCLNALDKGDLRICSKDSSKNSGAWVVQQYLKKAVLLSFRLNPNTRMDHGPAGSFWWDKVSMKTSGWSDEQFNEAGYRAVPGSFVRRGAYIAPNTVLMPSFVNIGAYVDTGTMVDTWTTIGSCAQIGKNCHISGGVGIGGVLEPLQANPVIIEDNVFIGARSEVAEGVIVEEGAVLSMGVYLGASTKIIDRETGEIFMGRVPAYSVVVSGSMPSQTAPAGQPINLYCAVIVKRVDARTREKTGINELLRD